MRLLLVLLSSANESPNQSPNQSIRVSDANSRPSQGVLQQLTASFCQGITSVTIQLPPAAPLQSVSLTGCRKLKQVLISAPQLADLSVDDCAQLHSLQLQCPSLTVLGASKCNSLTGFLPALDCPRLQQLNLFGCRQLESEGDASDK